MSLDTLNNLRSSQQSVERMQARHNEKKAGVRKRFLKRTGKRVAASAAAAATVGTVVVVGLTATFSVEDYCDEQRQLQEDEDVLFGTTTGFDLGSCMDAAREDSKALFNATKEQASDFMRDAWEGTKGFWQKFHSDD